LLFWQLLTDIEGLVIGEKERRDRIIGANRRGENLSEGFPASGNDNKKVTA
jgi:hypothetical protein